MYQTLILAGRMGRNPEVRYTPSGQAVTGFSVATDRSYTRSDGTKVKETTWFNCSAWGKMAEIVNEYGFKGQKVLIEGRLTPNEDGNPRIWTANDGSPKTSYEVSVGMCRFLEWKNEAPDAPGDSAINPNRLAEKMRERMGKGAVETAEELGGTETGSLENPEDFEF